MKLVPHFITGIHNIAPCQGKRIRSLKTHNKLQYCASPTRLGICVVLICATVSCYSALWRLKGVLQQVQSLFQSDFSRECELFFLFQFTVSSRFRMLPGSCLRLLPRLHFPCIYPSIKCVRSRLVHKCDNSG